MEPINAKDVTPDESVAATGDVASNVAEPPAKRQLSSCWDDQRKHNRGTKGNRGGAAPKGNRNAMKAGIFAIASLPKGASYIRRLVGTMRREVEAAVLDKHGEVSLYHAALAQSAARHEARAQLAQRYLRLHGADMDDGQRLAYMKEIGSASDARDRALKGLGLDRRDRTDVIAALYSAPDVQQGGEAEKSTEGRPGNQNATEREPGDSSGGAQ